MVHRLRLVALLGALALVACACATGTDIEITGSRAASPSEREGPNGGPAASAGSTADPPDSNVSYTEVIAKSLEDIQVFWRSEYPAVYGSDYVELWVNVRAGRS